MLTMRVCVNISISIGGNNFHEFLMSGSTFAHVLKCIDYWYCYINAGEVSSFKRCPGKWQNAFVYDKTLNTVVNHFYFLNAFDLT